MLHYRLIKPSKVKKSVKSPFSLPNPPRGLLFVHTPNFAKYDGGNFLRKGISSWYSTQTSLLSFPVVVWFALAKVPQFCVLAVQLFGATSSWACCPVAFGLLPGVRFGAWQTLMPLFPGRPKSARWPNGGPRNAKAPGVTAPEAKKIVRREGSTQLLNTASNHARKSRGLPE